ncbi:Glutaredoxin [compost metagenome]
MREVLVFSTPFCAKCPGVKQKLKAAGVDFQEIDAIKNPSAVSQYEVKGVPTVVVIEDGVWESYNSNNVGELISGL